MTYFRTETFETSTIDRVILKGLLYVPEKPKAVIQFNCGTGVHKGIYLSFLQYLAGQGYICCAWNYRGTEDPLIDLKYTSYTFLDYGTKDMSAVFSFLKEEYPNLPFVMMGHSAGGQQIGFMDSIDGIDLILNFGVSSGYYGHMPISYRIKAYWFFNFFAPLSIFFAGYVNAKKFNFMENLPKKVVKEWGSWLEYKHYFFDESIYGIKVPKGNFKKFNTPIHNYWAVDDTIANEKNVQAYWSHIVNQKEITFTKMIPKEYGVKSIGHFGFFKKQMRETLWKEVGEKISNSLN